MSAKPNTSLNERTKHSSSTFMDSVSVPSMSNMTRCMGSGLTTQAQRPGPRGRPIATWTRWPGSLQRVVRRSGHGLSFRVSYLISFWGGKMIFKSSFLLLTVWARVSRLQIPFFEFLRRRAEVAEVVNGRASGREGERLERFLEHLVEIFPRGEAGRDVRMVILAGMLRHELRNVGDQGRDDVGVFGRGDEGGRGSGFHRERGHSVNHLLFECEQFRSRFDDNARYAKVLVRYVIVFESFQLQAGHIGAGEDFADGGIDFIQILGEDETLHQGDVGTVGGIERKAFRKDLEQTLIGRHRVLEHCGIRLEQDVNGGDLVLVSGGCGWLGGGAAGAGGQYGHGTGERAFQLVASEVGGV